MCKATPPFRVTGHTIMIIEPMKWYGFRIPGTARGKQRPKARRLGRGVQIYTPDQTITEEAWVRSCCVGAVGQPFLLGAIMVAIEVVVPWPAAISAIPPARAKPKPSKPDALRASRARWFREAASRGEIWPTGKPDGDNMVKLMFDALNGILWADDSQVVSHSLIKRYGDTPGAVFTFCWLGLGPSGARVRRPKVDPDRLAAIGL